MRWKIPLISRAVYAVWRSDARRKYSWIEPWIAYGDRVIEVGSGPGSVIDVMRMEGHDVTGLDIIDSSFSSELAPIVYDGKTMPFTDDSFDIALILTTLHHTPDPDRILAEAMRVARRLVVIEDVYETRMQELYTKLTDKLTNLEFVGHPHSNRSDAGWRKTFDQLGLAVKHERIYPLLGIYQQAVYVLDRRSG